ncbi:MAG: YkgJ family cysteine cluster protein [Desulfobacterales bacterium]|nr:YkgJ family cysteine cluster protein [Desulfobacterales bacterium]
MRYELKCPEDFFECRQCGNCCYGFGGTRLSGRDVSNIADYLDISPRELIANYCQYAGKTLQLTQRKDGYCIFWDQLCTIHPVKPRMCKAWPFIESVLIDPYNWQIMAEICAGINPDVPAEQLKACVRSQLDGLDRPDDPIRMTNESSVF